LTSKFSRAALIAGLAIGASGLVAVPAEAANGVSTANYYVNNPGIGMASNVTPESAAVSASIDTGGTTESLLPVSSSGLSWNTLSGITATSEKWNDGTAPSAAATGSYAPLDGIPISGSNSNVSVTVTDSGDSAISTVPRPVSNAGADNYSEVTFEYDPVSDVDANGGQPGVDLQTAPAIDVPTTSGLSTLTTTIGAFGQAAQNNTGNTPLTPGTKYYFWIIQKAGVTDAATNVNIAQWAAQSANPTYKCYPNVAIQADPTLASYTSNTQITYDGTTAAALQGPCYYEYGDTSGAFYYQSPNGTFATPAIGKVTIGAKATATAKGADLKITDSSAYKASGTVDLTVGGKLAGTAKFSLQPKAKGTFKVVLTSRGKTAVGGKKTAKVAPISAGANVASVSNWDQPFSGKAVKL
jgi:hypothetical protein